MSVTSNTTLKLRLQSKILRLTLYGTNLQHQHSLCVCVCVCVCVHVCVDTVHMYTHTVTLWTNSTTMSSKLLIHSVS